MDLKKIVMATDFSEASLIALEAALSLSLESSATLHLVHVSEPPPVTDPEVEAQAGNSRRINDAALGE